jgi:hypothetical protein
VRKLIVGYAGLVGYSRLIGLDDLLTLEQLRTLRNTLIEPAINEHNGSSSKHDPEALCIATHIIALPGGERPGRQAATTIPRATGLRCPRSRSRASRATGHWP